MEPRIQYTRTGDGVSIAFWSLGRGMPLIVMPNLPFSHIELEWQIPEYRRWYERLMEVCTVVRYDNRGSGLSDCDVVDYSLDAHLRDLDAVAKGLRLQRFALLAPLYMGPLAIAFVVREPEIVSHLVLWCSFASVPDYAASPQIQTLAAMRDKDWIMYTETVAHAGLGWAQAEPARQYAALIRECATQDAVRAMLGAMHAVDVSGLLGRVTAPTLVLHRRQVPFPGSEPARALASGIPGARLALLEGTSLAPFLGDWEGAAGAIEEFLCEGEGATETGPPPGAFRTILFTDIEASTALTQRLGDAKAQELVHAHNNIVRDALKAHGGAEIKHTGDGIMAAFPTASSALKCAVSLQRAVEAYNAEAHGGTPLQVHIGLNAGEPVAEESDLFGTAVQLARRICDHAEGGEILVSNVVRELAAGKGFLFADRGEATLRGFEDPVRLYELRPQA